MNVLEQCAYRKLLKTTVNKFGYLEPLNNSFLYLPLDLRALVGSVDCAADFSTMQACIAVGILRWEICQMNRFQAGRIP